MTANEILSSNFKALSLASNREFDGEDMQNYIDMLIALANDKRAHEYCKMTDLNFSVDTSPIMRKLVELAESLAEEMESAC